MFSPPNGFLSISHVDLISFIWFGFDFGAVTKRASNTPESCALQKRFNRFSRRHRQSEHRETDQRNIFLLLGFSCLEPTVHDFSFFTDFHKSASRHIVYTFLHRVWIPKNLRSVIKCAFLPFAISCFMPSAEGRVGVDSPEMNLIDFDACWCHWECL